MKVLEEARNHFDAVADIAWPSELDLSPSPPGYWAQKRQPMRDAIQQSKTDRRDGWLGAIWGENAPIIPLIQCAQRLGFDHRGPRTDDWLGAIWKEIGSRFPSFSLQSSPICESVYSDFIRLFQNKLVSNIFFYHLEAYLSCTQRLCRNPRRVLEIGGGYGDLARLFKLGHPSVHYTIVDIPESLFFAEIFLRVNFPNCNLQYLQPNQRPLDSTDFCLVPVQCYSPLMHTPFNLAIIQGVLGEVSANALQFWIDFLENSKVRAVYSLNLASVPLELKNFEVVYREENPHIVSADVNMEFLELCLKRRAPPSIVPHRDIFESPNYWCGQLGYRPGPDGIGYQDFPLNRVKADYIMSKAARGKTLDIGCAMGFLVKRLRDRGVDAWGLDISEYAISRAPEDVKPYLKVGSADKLPWMDKEFDMVVSFSTFEHLPKDILAEAISEAIRVGKKGIISITPGDSPHFDEDVTHRIKEPLSWWRNQFPPEFEVRNDADEEWLKAVPDVSKIPTVQMLRHDWIRSKVTLNDRIAEIGCAENPVFAGSPFRVTTVDHQINPEIQIFPDVKAEAEHLPFEDEGFDIVCEGELLEHVPDPQQVLREAARVAKKKIVLTVPFEVFWPDDLKPFWNPGHVRFYDPVSLESELKPLGLPYKIELIRNGSWAWLGAEVYKEEAAVTSGMVKLNLGSFVDTLGNNWTNIDILAVQQYIPKDHKFKQWDLRRGIPYPDNSVDLIRASHLIEHFTLEEAHNLCREIYRVLKPGGFARILTPDARLILKHYLNNDMTYFNQIQPPEYILAPTEGEKLSRLLFSGDYSHKAVYDFEMLKSFLHQAGFELGKVYLVSSGFSRSPAMQQEAPDAHIEVSLIVEAIK